METFGKTNSYLEQLITGRGRARATQASPTIWGWALSRYLIFIPTSFGNLCILPRNLEFFERVTDRPGRGNRRAGV